jgi:hypothetical protein
MLLFVFYCNLFGCQLHCLLIILISYNLYIIKAIFFLKILKFFSFFNLLISLAAASAIELFIYLFSHIIINDPQWRLVGHYY